MAITLTSYGAAGEVTGSNHMLEINGEKILVDCGMFQGRRAESDEKNRMFLYSPNTISSVILTHAHCDHSGRLPMLLNHGYKGDIYSTPATRDIAGLIMSDSAYIQAKDAEWLKKKKSEHPFEPLYVIKDVIKTLNQFITVGYHRKFRVSDKVKAEYFDAGHILGSAMVVMDVADNTKIAFTGDLGRKGLAIIRDPEPLPDVDYLVCESTYGNRLHDPIEKAARQLADIIHETVNRGGKIIIPAFAVERTQDLIYYLHLLKDKRKIPDIDIFVDSPMAFNSTAIFKVHQECYDETVYDEFLNRHENPFGFEHLRYITDVSESKKLNDCEDSCIIISSSGMCEAGRILHHLKNNIEDPKNTILIVGFMAENTLGRKIVEKHSEVKIFGQPYKLNAQVKVLNTFSSHADYNDIKSYVSQMDLKRLKKVFLVHGETDALENMKTILLSVGVKDVVILERGVTVSLSD